MSDLPRLWQDGPFFLSDPAFPLSTDSILLADFAPTGGRRRAIDLCCGAGAVGVLLLHRCPELRVDGVELSERSAELCRRNLDANGWSERADVYNFDLRDCRRMLEAGSYGLVTVNPPYFPSGSGKAPRDAERSAARTEGGCGIDDVCAAAAYLLTNGGILALVHRCERMAEVLCAMSDARLEPKKLRLVSHRADSAPSLFLAEGKKGARAGLRVLPQLIIKDADGSDTPELRRIYHMEDK